MWDKLKINVWELNLILTIAGFPLFTTLIAGSIASIAYRGFAVLVALICIFKSRIHFPIPKMSKLLLIILLYESVQMWIDFYLGNNANTNFTYSRMQAMLYNIGVVILPTIAMCSGIQKINWNKVLWLVFFILFFVVVKGNLGTETGEISNDGRFNLNARISPLSYGDYSAFLLLGALSILMRYRQTGIPFRSITTWIIFFAIFSGIFGIAKAGSRGPLVGALMGMMMIFISFPKKWRVTSLVVIIVLLLSGIVSMELIKNFAPALTERTLQTIENGDMSNRDILFNAALSQFYSSPFIGTNPIYLEIKEFNSCHNVYLEVLVATGMIGGTIFCFIMLKLMLSSLYSKMKNRWTYPDFFFIALFLFHFGRGFSGIILVANAVIIVSFIIANHLMRIRSQQT